MFFLKFKTSVLSNNRFVKQTKAFQRNLFFKSDDGHAISHQETRRLPKSTARFSRQEKMAFSTLLGLSWDSAPPPPESVRGRAYVDVTTKVSLIDRLPNLP